MKRSGARTRIAALVAADAVSLVAAWSLSLWGYWIIGYGHYRSGWEFYLHLWPVAVVFVAVNAFFRLYHGSVFAPAAPVSPAEELRRLTGSSMIVHLGLLAGLAIAYQTTEHYSRAVTLIAGCLTAAISQPVRDAVRGLLKSFDIGQIPVFVKAPAEMAAEMAGAFRKDAYLGFRSVGFDEEADVAVFCLSETEVLGTLSKFTHVEYIPSGSLLGVGGARTVTFDGRCGIEFMNRRRLGALRFEKWLLDKVLATVAFILLSPLFVILPMLIKLTSRGPVFYRQERLGLKGKPIRVWKFRSMYADADQRLKAILASDPRRREEWERNFKLEDDPRITPLGRFLRTTSLDELPQLFNVYAGDMALVGPRPIVAGEVAMYGADFETFASVKPGVTGLWQVSGRSDTGYSRRVSLDIHYVLNWSPWLDFWILRKTVSAVLFMRGAR